jgi:hypothetical protein
VTPEYLRQTGPSATFATRDIADWSAAYGDRECRCHNVQASVAPQVPHGREGLLRTMARSVRYSWLPTTVLIRLASQVSPRELLVLALSAVILSALVRLAKAFGPTVVKLYRAQPVHSALRAYRAGGRSASDTAMVIDAITRFEVAARDGELAAGEQRSDRPGASPSKPSPQELAGALAGSPGSQSATATPSPGPVAEQPADKQLVTSAIKRSARG